MPFITVYTSVFDYKICTHVLLCIKDLLLHFTGSASPFKVVPHRLARSHRRNLAIGSPRHGEAPPRSFALGHSFRLLFPFLRRGSGHARVAPPILLGMSPPTPSVDCPVTSDVTVPHDAVKPDADGARGSFSWLIPSNPGIAADLGKLIKPRDKPPSQLMSTRIEPYLLMSTIRFIDLNIFRHIH